MADLHTPEAILIVSSDRTARTFLADNLSADGYEVLESGSVEAGRRLLTQAFVDLAIVHRELPDDDGIELLRFIREAAELGPRVDPNLPVILVGETASPLDRIRAFERGCDDYVDGAQVSYTELRARVGALLRRRRRLSTVARLRVGALEVDALARQAWVDGQPVRLSGKEFSLLLTLARDPGRVFTREELMATVWGWSDGRSAGRTRTLDSHASRLRRKLSAHGANYVINVWSVGYRLVDVSAAPPPAVRSVA